MDIINLSAEPMGRLFSWLPRDLKAEKVVFLPDACPGKSPLPTGTAVFTHQENWRKFAVSDCGCGMRFLRTDLSERDLNLDIWDAIADRLRKNGGNPGDLGGGNHFLDALVPKTGGSVHILIHTGSRHESGHVDAFVDKPGRFDAEFERVAQWASDNRAKIQEDVEAEIGIMTLIVDRPHNTFEQLDGGGIVIRKGSVRLCSGEISVIPSHISGDAVLVRATSKIGEILDSMCHGTGRSMPTGECKRHADGFDFSKMRQRILIPDGIEDASLRTEGPYAYRDIDECLMLIDEYIEELERYEVIAYMGHL